MTSIEEYSKVAIENNAPLFYQPWWLDTVYGSGNWNGIVVRNESKVLALMPYSLTKAAMFKFLMMPYFTPYQGPWLIHKTISKRYKLYYEEEIAIDGLIKELPHFSRFQVNCHPDIANGLPFYWNGFKVEVGYTYILQNLADKELLFSGFRSSIKRNIKKSRNIVDVAVNNSEDLFQAVTWTYSRQSKNVPGNEVMNRIVRTAIERGFGKVFSAHDKEGNLHAALFVVWDNVRAYYLMGGGHPLYRKSGAMAYLMWNAINFVSDKVKSFDFEGSMVQPIEHFFKGFGAERVPYLRVHKYNSKIIKLKHCLFK